MNCMRYDSIQSSDSTIQQLTGFFAWQKVQLRSLAGEDQLNEHGLEDDDEDDEGDIELEKLSQLCEHTTAAEQHVSRWGAVPGSEERGKNKMEYADSPDSPRVGQMDNSDILDDMSSVEYDTGMLMMQPFASNGAHARTVTPARSGDSIASDDPFLPPGLGPLALSLSPLPTFSTCIQPGSAAASSSRSRMSFALLTNEMMDSAGSERVCVFSNFLRAFSDHLRTFCRASISRPPQLNS
jgi:hypothetical protein